jgi:RNA-directed DNA polymerase
LPKFEDLRHAASLIDFAPLLGFTPSGLAYVLYKIRPETLYTTFEIAKKSGGVRKIQAPNPKLKLLQKRLAKLLTLCLRDIEAKHPVRKIVSHGFQEKRSIVTNASHHRRRRYVLNLDIADFFGTINFGRVRGFFIHDQEFQLNPRVATVIAQIACYENALPQGSPCSPIISNLIGAILDRRLIALAKEYKCTYTRYADDLTFSTHARQFSRKIAYRKLFSSHEWHLGRRIVHEIKDVGFSINHNKTCMQIIGSRQVTTGLVVNTKVNIAQDYYRDTRAMCHSLFKTGQYHRPGGSDLISELAPLEGRLAHIHYVKSRRDRTDDINKEANLIVPRAPDALYQRFLYYKFCVANTIPTIITEGRSDIIYLRAAIKSLGTTVQTLIRTTNGKIYPNVTFLRHSTNNSRILDLSGGTGGIVNFIHLQRHKIKPYTHAPMSAPVIILIDNDEGAKSVFKAVKSAHDLTINHLSPAPFHHLSGNLYLVKTPVGALPSGQTCIEDLFPPDVLSTKIDGKPFDKNKLHGDHSSYGKIVFADKVIRPQASTIDFSGFVSTLQALVAVISHYKGITAASLPSAASA